VAAILLADTRCPDAFEDVRVAIPASFRLESGGALSDGYVRLRWHGRRDGPVVLVAGGISAGRTLCGQGGWWGDIVGDGCAVDLTQFSALGFEFAPDSDVRAIITPRDQARLLILALDALGIERVHAFVGASYGGLVGLSLAELAPQRVGRLCAISAAHEPAPLASAWRGVQRRIVGDAAARGAAAEGLALARQLAMITYRSAEEFAQRFDRVLDSNGRSDLDRYLDVRGRAYPNAMGPQRWLALSEAIDRARLTPESITTPTTLIAAESDQLVPVDLVRTLAARMPSAALHVIPSLYGHDAFLKEPEQLTPIIRSVLESAHVTQ
jgi:homoserine O-acetyltransferase/O-succinyltransferase